MINLIIPVCWETTVWIGTCFERTCCRHVQGSQHLYLCTNTHGAISHETGVIIISLRTSDLASVHTYSSLLKYIERSSHMLKSERQSLLYIMPYF
jgi:hypothetical protein